MQKPLSIKVNDLKENILKTILDADVHPIIIGMVLEEVNKEVEKVIEKTNEYEQQEYSNAIKLEESEKKEEKVEDGEN